MCFLGFVLIVSFVSVSLCHDVKTDFIKVDVNVHRVPPNNLQFQFQKNSEIKTISLQEGNVQYFVLENNDSKYFLDPKPVESKENNFITLTLKYHYSNDDKIQDLQFGHTVRENPNDVIVIRFPVQPPLPQMETCTSGKCDLADTDLIDYWPTEQIDGPFQGIEPTAKIDNIDEETLEESCDNDCNYTEELLDTALLHGNFKPNLVLKGLGSTSGNPVDTIRSVIFKVLNLPHLEYEILQAKYLDEGLVFEMKTQKDAVEVLRQTQTTLKKTGLKIELTELNVFCRDKDEIPAVSIRSQ